VGPARPTPGWISRVRGRSRSEAMPRYSPRWHGEVAARNPAEGAAASADAVGAAGPTGQTARSEVAGAAPRPIPDRGGRRRWGERPHGGAAGGLRCDHRVPLGCPVQCDRVRVVRATLESSSTCPIFGVGPSEVANAATTGSFRFSPLRWPSWHGSGPCPDPAITTSCEDRAAAAARRGDRCGPDRRTARLRKPWWGLPSDRPPRARAGSPR